MACYLFTYHGYGTWWPDDPRGYVHRTRGLQPRDDRMARRYRENQGEPGVWFTPPMQCCMIQTLRESEPHVEITVHAIACEPTHVHVLISWSHDRDWKSLRTSLRSAMSRELNGQFERRSWFADFPSRKRVRDHDHFDYLVLTYLPKHRGEQWFREIDIDRAQRRQRQ